MSAIVSNEDVIKAGDTVYINGFKGTVESVDRDICSLAVKAGILCTCR